MAEENPEQDGGPGRTLGRLVGSVVSPIVSGLDVDEVVDQIDVDEVVARIDVDEVVGRIDVDKVVGRIDIDEVVGRIDIDEVVGRIDIDEVVGRIDIDEVVGRIDIDKVVDRVDLDQVLDGVDPNRLLDRVDPDALLDRVDPNRLLDRVDPNALLDRVDANRLMDRVDLNQLVARTELGEIIARSTTGVFTQLLDVARTQIIITDQVAQGVPARILRGARQELPPRPDGLDEEPDSGRLTATERAVKVQGRFAGSVSRFLAFLVDQFAIGVIFAVGALLVQSAVSVIFQTSLNVEDEGPLVVVAYSLWWFLYTAGSLAATGRTIGKAILGVMVVRSDGTKVNGRRAALRTLVFPLSFLVLGIGFLIGLFRHDRRELHDLIADTGVVYAWDADTAQLRARDEGANEIGVTYEPTPATPATPADGS